MAATKADHPVPARAMHLVHLLSIITLVATGFFLHKPNFSLFGLSMHTARLIHNYAGFVIILNLVTRFYWSIFGAPGDIGNFLPEKENRGKFFPMLAYYTFTRRTRPVTAKYNTLQKSTYAFWFLLLLFQAITGFAMLWNMDPGWASLVAAMGGLANVHMIHYLTMWVFIVTTMVHIYLVLFEDFRSFKLMFLGIETEESPQPGEAV
ncbi:MAG TPA: hypothetical protein ENH32_00440 [Proteobacteria bacterium]|nr:quinone-reactive Ni/Fe-hydrogenase B-type cytochrome subunit [bacterium BMS3Abin14]HDL52427.1 hypothetical protein [Pseudomonadota bacterium]